MKLSIKTHKLSECENTWMSYVDWDKHEGGQVGTPGAIKYGTSEEESRSKLKEYLTKNGHEILD